MGSISPSLTQPLFVPEALRTKNHLSPVGLVCKRGILLSSKSKNRLSLKELGYLPHCHFRQKLSRPIFLLNYPPDLSDLQR